MSKRLLRHFSVLSYALLGLISGTVALLIWHHFGMQRELVLNRFSGHEVSVFSDSTEGGSSEVALKKQANAHTMLCAMKKSCLAVL